MQPFVDFEIHSSDTVSTEFVNRSINSFGEAATFIKQLPYGRNADKLNLTTVFNNHCGTCSTKHALLKLLATENDFRDLRLIMGLFKMNGINTPKVAARLSQHGLEYIPEAHCYLKHGNEIMDFTKQNSSPSDFVDDLIEEIEIQPSQITDFKVSYHKDYLKKWLEQNEHIKFPLAELWQIRENCILDLSQ